MIFISMNRRVGMVFGMTLSNVIVAPMPIGWIGSGDSQGVLNLAPYSFFNAHNYTPPIISFAGTRLDVLDYAT
jgi:flavin reductase (DIM6/NTAB) family NADH-FMN oxidoreductase RutF